MKNPRTYCPQCNKLHDNPLIERFNSLIATIYAKGGLPKDAEPALYRAFMAGAFDCFMLMSMISTFPENLAVHLVNQVALNIRDAVLAEITDPVLKKQLVADMTEQLGVKENDCRRN